MVRKYRFVVGDIEEVVEIDFDDEANEATIEDKVRDTFVDFVWNNIDASWKEVKDE